MEFKQFKNIQLSRLGMGNMRLPIVDNDNAKIDYEKGQRIIDECMTAGINYYDTAYIYHNGLSEVFVGKALNKYPRDSYYVADKFNLHANPNFKEQFEEQLQRLNVDYIDFYLLHGVADDNIDDFLKSECIEYFNQLKQEGKITYLGFSFHGKPSVLKRMVEVYDWDFVQIQLNYYDWFFGTAKEQYDLLTEKQIPVMVMEPIHGGMLATLSEEAKNELDDEYSPASWALRFVMDLDNCFVILSGMSTLEQTQDNIQTFNTFTKLTKTQHEKIEASCKITHQTTGVPCTACRYCVNHCPMQLEIPELLKFYNEYKSGGKWRLNRLNGEAEDKLPSNCIACGMCTVECPQNIEVYRFLKEMADDFETMKKDA